MHEDEMSELRRDIKNISIQLALLAQKVDTIIIPSRPCDYYEEHIERYHTNTLSEKIREKAVDTLIPIIILTLAGWIYIGFANDIKIKQNESNPVVSREK